ncbi:MAG: hypothetical protein CVU96_02485 [Firmicutes bacterium HGW-Firmicutes-20]|jgi:ABC-type uncharacterized transport system permease subunit|nr:MAG: hypothetical protein CVU96_02485 [Firmicutes bacterium HGW-Firmicutes-20]PKM68416.1 MAG: hypothetical protein CVU94_05440 [Firmicutes bacterium HGW-Firmicutes-19]
MKTKDRNDFPSWVLLFVGIFDVIRGFMHTFNISWAVDVFAKLDLSVAKDAQLFLLAAFGISNYLTGFIFILISRKAKHLSVYMLSFILAAYALGVVAMRVVGLTKGDNAFRGMYIMMGYLLICLLTLVKFAWDHNRIKSI